MREYSIKGYTQRDIAAEQQVSLRLIKKDLAYLRLKAKGKIRNVPYIWQISSHRPDYFLVDLSASTT
jgi:hypothetical protein